MGKSIQKKWFGLPLTAGSGHIVVDGVKFADGTTSTNAYIVKQTGSTAYVVQDASKAHAAEIVFLANANAVGGLKAGQCFILAQPFGGAEQPCSKISQFRLSVFNADGSYSNYKWSTVPAVAAGQADLVAAAGVVIPGDTALPVVTGAGAHPASLTTTNGTWTGSTPITYTYQWLLSATPIAGATLQSYVAAAAGTYSVNVTATNPAGSATITSATVTVT